MAGFKPAILVCYLLNFKDRIVKHWIHFKAGYLEFEIHWPLTHQNCVRKFNPVYVLIVLVSCGDSQFTLGCFYNLQRLNL